MKNFVLITIVLFTLIKAQVVQKDPSIKFAQYYIQKMREYGNNSIEQVQNLSFKPNFENVPKIIIGIMLYNNDKNLNQTNFNVQPKNITTQGCQLELALDNPTYILYSLTISILAIDISQMPNLYVSELITYTLTNPKLDGNNRVYEYDVPYNIKNYSGDKQIALFLNGFNSSINNERYLNLYIQRKIEEKSFKIIITSTNDSKKIQSVYLQYIEYVESSDSNYFVNMFTNEHLNHTLTPTNYSKHEKLSLSQPNVINSSNLTILYGMNSFKFDHGLKEDTRQNITIASFQNNYLEFDYNVWGPSSSFGVASSIVVIGMKTCGSWLYIYKGDCYTSCTQGNDFNYYQQVKLCVCNQKAYYYMDEKIALPDRKEGNYCNPIDSNCFLCEKCNINNCKECSTKTECKTCIDGYHLRADNTCEKCISNCKICSDQVTCEICNDGNFKYENQCFSQKPDGTFCDGDKVCFSCKENCKDCSNPNQQSTYKCNQCKDIFYKIQENCVSSKPDNSYCDSNKNCVKCKEGCADCSDPQSANYTCNLCIQGHFQLNQNCFPSQPPNTYCDSKNVCTSCKEGCQKCTDPNLSANYKCEKCIDQYYQIKQDCYIDIPPNATCDSNRICTFCKQGCEDCTDPSNTNYECYKCKVGFYLYQQLCFEQKPSSTFCDKNQICQKCNLVNCLECTDPSINPEKCINCYQDYYKYLEKCQFTKPAETFCDNKKQCKQCHLDYCLDCTDPDDKANFKCNQCKENSFLYQERCLSVQPPNTYCNSNNICKDCIDRCSSCSDPDDLEHYKCFSCNESDFLYKDKCQLKESIPPNTFCDVKQRVCKDCINKGCEQCEQDLVSCMSCLNPLILQNKRCVCSEEDKFYDQSTKNCLKCEFPCKQCEENSRNCIKCGDGASLIQKEESTQTCQCNQKDFYFNEQYDCFKCDSSLKPVINNGITTCECHLKGFYLNHKLNLCLQCSIKYCNKCNIDGESCLSCEEGFKHNINSGNYKQCQYCTGSIYADRKGDCQNELQCKKGCLRCTNSISCDQYEDNHVFMDDECHYSCSECLGQGQYDCQKCSSTTREFNLKSNSCPCRSGYKENDQEFGISPNLNSVTNKESDKEVRKDCLVDKNLTSQNSSQINRERMINAVYILFLPQLFINIHPFADYFIYTLQILGNSSLLSSDRDLLEQMTIFNYFNILINHQFDSTKEKQFKATFTNYKTIIDPDVTYNLLILVIFYFLGVILSIASCVLKYFCKISLGGFERQFLWNFLLKIIRISSNYLLLNIIVHIKNIAEASIISHILIIALLTIYIFNIFVQIKQSNTKDQSNYKYINENLNIEITFHKYFWLIIEGKKLLIVLSIGFVQPQFHQYIVIIISIISIIIMLKQKPGLNIIRDTLYLVFNQFFLISVSSIQIIALKQYENNNISVFESLRSMIDYVLFIFGFIQYLYCCEYLFRMWRLRRNNNHQMNSRATQVPIFLQMPETINYQNIHDILNNSYFEQYPKLSFISKKKKI